MFQKSKWMILVLCLTTTLCACGGTNHSAESEAPGSTSSGGQDETQYDYQLKAGEPMEVYDVVFDQMVTVTVDPDSTRDAGKELRSDILFDNCTFHGGLTIVGDYHAMISLGSGCSFDEGAAVIYQAVSPAAAKETVLEDNLVKLFIACESVSVETESAMGVLTDGPDVVVNDTVYSKHELAPDTDFLGIYSLYEGDTITYLKLAIGEDDSVVFLD